MEINHQATKEKFDAMGLSQSKVARINSHNPAVFHQVLIGTYPSMNSDAAKGCINTLRKLGVLVVKDDQEQAA